MQETFVVYDCIKYDVGTIADHNDSIWNSLVGVTRDDEYTVFNYTGIVNRFVQITGDIIIELDLMSDMARGGSVSSIRDSGTTNLQVFSLANLGMTTNNWKHLIIRIEDNLLSIDDTSISGVDITGFAEFGIRASANYHTYFKNLKIYSI